MGPAAPSPLCPTDQTMPGWWAAALIKLPLFRDNRPLRALSLSQKPPNPCRPVVRTGPHDCRGRPMDTPERGDSWPRVSLVHSWVGWGLVRATVPFRVVTVPASGWPTDLCCHRGRAHQVWYCNSVVHPFPQRTSMSSMEVRCSLAGHASLIFAHCTPGALWSDITQGSLSLTQPWVIAYYHA